MEIKIHINKSQKFTDKKIIMKKNLLFIVFIIAMSGFVQGQIRYVTSNGAGLKNGTDWSNAYDSTKLQTAIEEEAVPVITEVWVAAGTYTPGTLVTDYFSLKSGVAIYGGFAGSEVSLTARNWMANVTILSGEIGQPGIATDNCTNVIYNSGVGSSAILDGFTIQGGYNGIGMGKSGGGIFNHASSPMINNCTITGNTGSFGAGIYNIESSSPMLTNCLITNNSSRRGGGICNNGSSPTLINCNITYNTATIDGGGIMNQNSSAPIFINCTIAGNSAVTYAGGVYNTTSAITTLNNSIIWGNGAGTGGKQIYVESGSAILDHSCYADDAANSAANIGGLITVTNSIVLDPQFVVAGGNDFLIAGNSPCVDAGLDSYNTQENDLRGTGFGRKLDKLTASPGIIDIGAYEYKFGVDPVGSVSFTWSGTTDTDWNNVGNWPTTVPTIADAVVIPAGVTNYPMISTALTCYNLTISTGASLTITSTGAISVTGTIVNNGTLAIQSDAVRTGSLIAGNASGTGITVAQKYLTARTWNMVSSPVSGQTIASFLTSPVNLTNIETTGTGRGMMDYDPTMDMWNSMFTNSTVGIVGGGKGFSLRLQGTTDAPVEFTGSLQAGPISVSTVIDKWNSVGNPYTSAIRINSNAGSGANFLTSNAASLDPMYGVYVWEKSYVGEVATGQYTAISNVPSLLPSDSKLEPGQAIMVKMKPTVSGVSFNKMMQIHSAGVEPTTGVWPTIKLSATVNNHKSSTIVAFNSKMTNGLDLTYDAGLFKGGSEMALYTRLVTDNGFSFAIQALPENEFNTVIVPVGIDSKSGGEVVFSAEVFNLPLLGKAILEDKLTNTFTDLSLNNYTVTIDANTSAFDRFQLRTSFLTGIDKETVAGQLSAYSIRNTEIRVTGGVSKLAIATLYDIQGKVILVNNLEEGSLNSIRTPNLKTGIYVLTVKDNQRVQRFKIPVR